MTWDEMFAAIKMRDEELAEDVRQGCVPIEAAYDHVMGQE